MDNQLEEFKKAYEHLQDVRKGFTLFKDNWYAWNYWAQHRAQFSFSDWMDENKLNFDKVSGSKQNYPGVQILRTREEGYRYYSAWVGGQQAMSDAEEEFDELFETLWQSQDSQSNPTFSSGQLGKAIGRSGEELRKFASKKSWYTPRKRKGNQK